MSAPLQSTATPPLIDAASSSKELLQQLQAHLEPSLLAAVIGRFDSYEYELQHALLKNQVLEERLRLARIAKYGKASEKLSDLQLNLLELEPGVSSEEVEAESQREPLVTPPDALQEQSTPKATRKHPSNVRRCPRICLASKRSSSARPISASAADAAKRLRSSVMKSVKCLT